MKKIITAVILATAIFVSIADAKTTRKRTYNWESGETCIEKCTTDSFGNTRCTEYCY
jgi:hypothetical protein